MSVRVRRTIAALGICGAAAGSVLLAGASAAYADSSTSLFYTDSASDGFTGGGTLELVTRASSSAGGDSSISDELMKSQGGYFLVTGVASRDTGVDDASGAAN